VLRSNIFWIFGKLTQAFGPDSLHILLRLPQNLFDLGTALLIFFFVRQRYSYLFALGAMAVYALNPATIFDLAVWGQMDSIYTFFMVGSLYAAMRSKHELSAGLLGLAILTKPQSIVLLPVVAYLILRKGGWKRAITSSAVFQILRVMGFPSGRTGFSLLIGYSYANRGGARQSGELSIITSSKDGLPDWRALFTAGTISPGWLTRSL
jgi:Gpi18-like mannosyltransferase